MPKKCMSFDFKKEAGAKYDYYTCVTCNINCKMRLMQGCAKDVETDATMAIKWKSTWKTMLLPGLAATVWNAVSVKFQMERKNDALW